MSGLSRRRLHIWLAEDCEGRALLADEQTFHRG